MSKASSAKATQIRHIQKMLEIAIQCIEDPDSTPNEEDREQEALAYRRFLSLTTRLSKTPLSALRTFESDMLTRWQELPHAETFDFWRRIKAAGLPYSQRNLLRDLLERPRIASRADYELAIDEVGSGVASGRISMLEREKLSEMIGAYERTQAARRGRGSRARK